jgi:hypothetical protein
VLNIAVIGAGIIGLTVGKSLQKSGHKVTFIANDFDTNVRSNKIDRNSPINPTKNASPVAASFWLPFGLDTVDTTSIVYKDQVEQFVATLLYWHSIAECYKTSIFKGFVYVPEHAIKALRTSQKIKDALNFIRNAAEGYDPFEFAYISATTKQPMFRFVTYVIDPRVFLPILYQELESENIPFIKQEVNSFEELQVLAENFDYVVKCTGAGSLNLKNKKNNNVDDDKMLKIRGDVLIFNRKNFLHDEIDLKINANLHENISNTNNKNPQKQHEQQFRDLIITTSTNEELFQADENKAAHESLHEYENIKLAYIVLSGKSILFGGTYVDEVETAEKTFFHHSDEMRAHIFNKCSALIPEAFPTHIWNNLKIELMNEEQVTHATGFRPKNSGGVRVRASNDDEKIIDNFGHSGSGWTMCWGSAKKVVDIIDEKQQAKI